jgi:hypothetical protein
VKVLKSGRTALLEGTEAGAAGSIIKASGVGAKDRQRLNQRTAVYGPVRTVVWEGRSLEAPPYPDSQCGAFGGRALCGHRLHLLAFRLKLPIPPIPQYSVVIIPLSVKADLRADD